MREVSNKVHNAELKLFLEVERGPVILFFKLSHPNSSLKYLSFQHFSFLALLIQDLRPIAPPEKTKEDILLFFKLYDPEKEELRYLFFFCIFTQIYVCISFPLFFNGRSEEVNVRIIFLSTVMLEGFL